jgi:predicted PurR-regulated permease PerM
MFLYNKRTRKVIRALWAVFAVLIILSMVFAYSGFTALPATAPTTQQPVQVTPTLISTSTATTGTSTFTATSTSTTEAGAAENTTGALELTI